VWLIWSKQERNLTFSRFFMSPIHSAIYGWKSQLKVKNISNNADEQRVSPNRSFERNFAET